MIKLKMIIVKTKEKIQSKTKSNGLNKKLLNSRRIQEFLWRKLLLEFFKIRKFKIIKPKNNLTSAIQIKKIKINTMKLIMLPTIMIQFNKMKTTSNNHKYSNCQVLSWHISVQMRQNST